MADFKMVDHQDTNGHKVELLVKLWTGNRLKVQSSTWTAYDMKHIYQLANSCRSFFLSVIGQPATGLLVKVLKMRHKTELSGGHWTFMRKMWAFLLANCLSVQDEPFVNIVQADGLYWINRISSRFSRWNDNGINNRWYDVQGNVRSAKSSLYSISYTVHGSCVIITPRNLSKLQFDTDNYFPEDSVFSRPEAVIKVPAAKRRENFHILMQISPYCYSTSRGFS